MSRLAARFRDLRAVGRCALIPFITAGDPHPDRTVPLMHGLVAAGADVLELGVPFSDPMAEGPVIQRACERALAHGVSLSDVLAMVTAFRRDDADTPVVLMGYLNPVESMGAQRFAEAAAAAGVDGVILLDMAADEAPDVAPAIVAAGIDPIFLLAPTTGSGRMARICGQASGFVYYVSLKGVTGSDRLDTGALAARIQAIREHSDLPVAVGFGIRTPEAAAAVARVADAVVVGSALVARVAEIGDDEAALLQQVPRTLAAMRAAMDAERIHAGQSA